MPAVPKKFTPALGAFVTEYLQNGRIASKAWRVAYPNRDCSETTARQNACAALKHPEAVRRIAEADDRAQRAVDRATDRYAVSRERIAEEFASLGFANIADFYTVDPKTGDLNCDISKLDRRQTAAIVKIRIEEMRSNRGPVSPNKIEPPLRYRTTIELGDKRAALMDLARLKGYIVERKDVRVIRALEDLTDEELQTLASADETLSSASSRH